MRGVHFALDAEQTRRVLASCEEPSGDDEADVVEPLADVIGEIEREWDEDWLCEMDKAWNAIHRVLGDGTLKGPTPVTALSQAVLGGRCLDDESTWFLEPPEVMAVARALIGIDEPWFCSRFDALKTTSDYDGPGDERDREYSWSYFGEMRKLFARAAADGRAMVFNV